MKNDQEDELILDINDAMEIITEYFSGILAPEMFEVLIKDEQALKEGALCLFAAMISSEQNRELQDEFDCLPPSQYN